MAPKQGLPQRAEAQKRADTALRTGRNLTGLGKIAAGLGIIALAAARIKSRRQGVRRGFPIPFVLLVAYFVIYTIMCLTKLPKTEDAVNAIMHWVDGLRPPPLSTSCGHV